MIYLYENGQVTTNLELDKANTYAKTDLIPSIGSQDIKRKRNFDNNYGP